MTAPTYRWSVPYIRTHGDIAIRMMSRYGLELDPWQKAVVRDILAIGDDNKWANPNAGFSLPRQNGKTEIVNTIAVYCAVMLGEKILFTSHELKTAAEAFDRMLIYFTDPDNDDLFKAVQRIHRAPGKQAIFLKNGGAIRFISREKNSGRGFTVDRIIFDEAQHTDEASVATLIPASSAGKKQNSSAIYCGTPPGPEHNGETFARVRKAGYDRKPGTYWAEWSADTENLDPDDRDTWLRVNPSLSMGRLQEAVIHIARESMSEDQFLREVLGVWGTGGTKSAIDPVSWERVKDENSKIANNPTLAISVDPQRRWASVSVAGQRDDGDWHIELVDCREGVGWLAPFVASLLEQAEAGWFRGVVADGFGAALSVIEDLKKAGVRVTVLGTKDVLEASQGFFDGVMERRVWHIGQTQLSTAVGASRRRTVSSERGWVFSQASQDVDVTPLISCVLALYGASTTSKPMRKPVRKPRDESAVTRGRTGRRRGILLR